jgi:hypothetical protein
VGREDEGVSSNRPELVVLIECLESHEDDNKAHRGDPLNEETDIKAEMGRLKEQKEVTWDKQTKRTPQVAP